MTITRTSVINDPDVTAKSYFVTPSGITIIGTTKVYKTYADMKADRNPPLYASVTDATQDPTVKKGGAIYKITINKKTGVRSYKKIFEEEIIDLDTFDWSQITNRPSATIEAIDTAVALAHDHDNKNALDGFSLIMGKLAWEGITVPTASDIESLSRRCTASEATLRQHENTFISHQSAINTISVNVNNNANSISALNVRVNGVESVLATKANTTTVNQIATDLQELEIVVNNNHEEFTTSVNAIRESISDLSGTVENARTELNDKIDAHAAANDTKFTEVDETLATKASITSVSKLEDRVSANTSTIETKADAEQVNTRFNEVDTRLNEQQAVIETKADTEQVTTKFNEIDAKFESQQAVDETHNNKILELEQSIAATNQDLANETTRATQAEAANTTAINELSETVAANKIELDKAVADETTRATGIETQLTTRISEEVTRATNAEADLLERINESTARVYRAKGPATYDQLFTPGTDGYIAEKEVGDVYHVEDAGTNGTSAEYVWTGDEWEELGTAIDLTDYYNKAAVDAKETSIRSDAADAVHTLNTKVEAEIVRATDKEDLIDARVSDEITRASAAEGNLSKAIQDETTRATEAETELGNRINTIETTPIQSGYHIVTPAIGESVVVHANDWIIVPAGGITLELLDSTADNATGTNIVKITIDEESVGSVDASGNVSGTQVIGNLIDNPDGIILDVPGTIEFYYTGSGWKAISYATTL